jgi:hypothetical protein
MALSGQTTVAAAGTAVALGTETVNGPVLVKALDTNTGIVAVGNDGLNDVSVGNGLRLAAGEEVYFEWVGNLGMLFVDAAVNGEGVGWVCLAV